MTTLLDMRGISKAFVGVKALSDVNFTVRQGEIHALVGENGAGKSTLMKVLSGVYPHGDYEGSIIFEGQERHFRDINDSEALGIIIIHQELALIPLLSIAENIFIANPPSRFGIVDRDAVYKRSQQLLAKVGLNEAPDTLVTNIGVGKQQLVEIAKALSKQVRLLILDEPTASLNESDSAALLDLLLESGDRLPKRLEFFVLSSLRLLDLVFGDGVTPAIRIEFQFFPMYLDFFPSQFDLIESVDLVF